MQLLVIERQLLVLREKTQSGLVEQIQSAHKDLSLEDKI
jgi:hypothetical protein